MRADAKINYETILSAAKAVFLEEGANASLREIARRAGVGMGTFYRHFPSREALLDVLLRESFNALAEQADLMLSKKDSGKALTLWVQDVITFTYDHRGIISIMMDAIEDPDSALHVSCKKLRSAGSTLLSQAQSKGVANPNLSGDELFDLIAALAWLHERPAHASRADRIFNVIATNVLMRS